MTSKQIKFLELHFSMNQFLIKYIITNRLFSARFHWRKHVTWYKIVRWLSDYNSTVVRFDIHRILLLVYAWVVFFTSFSGKTFSESKLTEFIFFCPRWLPCLIRSMAYLTIESATMTYTRWRQLVTLTWWYLGFLSETTCGTLTKFLAWRSTLLTLLADWLYQSIPSNCQSALGYTQVSNWIRGIGL